MVAVCVFCSANNEVLPKYSDVARKCGQLLGEHGYDLVYGGSSNGLMGVVANSAKSHNISIIGVFPEVLKEKESLDVEKTNVIITEHIADRKYIMLEKSSAFLILPGGFGTLDEFFEVITLKQLGIHDKPIILVNEDDYWRPLLSLIEHIYDSKFALKKSNIGYQVVDRIEDAFFLLNSKFKTE